MPRAPKANSKQDDYANDHQNQHSATSNDGTDESAPRRGLCPFCSDPRLTIPAPLSIASNRRNPLLAIPVVVAVWRELSKQLCSDLPAMPRTRSSLVHYRVTAKVCKAGVSETRRLGTSLSLVGGYSA